VASGQGSSPGLVVDNGVIYWTNSDQGIVAKADVNGGASTMIAANQGVMVGLAIGGSNLYWTSVEMAAVMKVAVGGGDVTTVAGGQSFSTNGANGQIAVRDAKVFWITDGGAVRSASVEGGATATLATLSVCRGLAVNTTNVFASCMSWGLSKLAWDGSGRTTLVGGYYGPFAIDSASIYHYWTPGLRRIDLDGGSPTVLTSTSASGPLTVDAADVYFTNGGTLMKMGIGGGSPSTVVAASGTSTAIVAVTVDDTRIYWRTMGGDVLKVEK